MLKKSLGRCIDWSKIDKLDYINAMIRSAINELEIKFLLEKALTKDIDSREVYMRGIQQSYYYEDLDNYSMEEVEKERKKKRTDDLDL